MNTQKNNGKGAKDVTPATTNKQAVTAKANETATAPKGEEIQKAEEKPAVTPATEEKPAPVIVEMGKGEQPKQRTLEEQIQYFLGLERLVNIRRRFQTHLEAVNSLEIEEDELTKFETGNNYGVRIELHDSKRREYNITNPKLVKEMLAHLASLLEGKISEYDAQILNYGTAKQ